jgi:hypothetical protein
VGRPPRHPSTVQSVQIGVRLTFPEKDALDALIVESERAAGLVAGSISPGTYIRSVIVQHLQSKGKVAKVKPAPAPAQPRKGMADYMKEAVEATGGTWRGPGSKEKGKAKMKVGES